MASDLPYLWLAIYNRLNGDTGSGGLANVGSPLITAIYNTQGPQATDSGTTPFPYIVYSTGDSQNDSELRTRGWRREVILDVWVERDPNSTQDSLLRGASILRRIEGDWEDQSAGTAPTFGLDRWQPDLSAGGWGCTIMEAVSSREEHDEDFYHWVLTYTVRPHKTGV